MSTANEISKRIEDFLNDRCMDGWTVTASKMYGDDVRHNVTVEFESRGGTWKFEASFVAWLEDDEVLFEHYDGAGQGEPIQDLLWQWLFWELMKGQE
jgi:hypothetical protein